MIVIGKDKVTSAPVILRLEWDQYPVYTLDEKWGEAGPQLVIDSDYYNLSNASWTEVYDARWWAEAKAQGREEEYYDLAEKFEEDVECVEVFAKHFGGLCLPVYLYDHSGIAISLSSFSCRWDSSQAGWLVWLPSQRRQWHNDGAPLDDAKDEDVMRALFEDYAAYVAGSCWIGTAYDDADKRLKEFPNLWERRGEDTPGRVLSDLNEDELVELVEECQEKESIGGFIGSELACIQQFAETMGVSL